MAVRTRKLLCHFRNAVGIGDQHAEMRKTPDERGKALQLVAVHHELFEIAERAQGGRKRCQKVVTHVEHVQLFQLSDRFWKLLY